MHDVFRLDDLTNDTQHYALSRWTDIARRNPVVPLAEMLACWRVTDALDRSILLNLAPGSIRSARVERVGAAVQATLAVEAAGQTLSQLMPADYMGDLIPAYAFCAGAFRPMSSLDEVTHGDGTVALVRRLILPLERQPPGTAFTAQYLLMLIDHAPDGTLDGDEAAEPPVPCQMPIRSNRTLSLAMFRDKAE